MPLLDYSSHATVCLPLFPDHELVVVWDWHDQPSTFSLLKPGDSQTNTGMEGSQGSALMLSCKQALRGEARGSGRFRPRCQVHCVLPMALASLPWRWVFWKANKQALLRFYGAKTPCRAPSPGSATVHHLACRFPTPESHLTPGRQQFPFSPYLPNQLSSASTAWA